MHLVPKPEGYDLRDKRSDKENDATKWGVRDALYSASECMTDKCDAVTVVWREEGRVYRRNAGPRGSTIELTVEALGVEMGWKR